MHILHVIDSLEQGGAERVLVDLANASVASGRYRVSVCITREEGILAAALDARINVEVVRRKTRLDWRGMRRLVRHIHARKIDVLHAHNRSTFSLLAALKAVGQIRHPILLHDHWGIDEETNTPLWFKLGGRHLLSAYVGAYDDLARWAQGIGVPSRKTYVAENALDLERIRSAPPADLRHEFGIGQDVRIGLFVGGLRRVKGLHDLIGAVSRCSEYDNIKIVVIGGERDPVYVRECKALSSRLEVDGSFLYVGERSDVPALIRGADFGIIASLREAGPLTLIEFMAAGLPVIATRVGAVANRAAKEGIPGIVKPGDVEGMAAELDALDRMSAEHRAARGALGNYVANKFFEIHARMPTWDSIYPRAAS